MSSVAQCIQYAKPLGCILISDLVVARLVGIILQSVFYSELLLISLHYTQFCSFMQGWVQDVAFGANAPQFLISTEAYLDNVFQIK